MQDDFKKEIPRMLGVFSEAVTKLIDPDNVAMTSSFIWRRLGSLMGAHYFHACISENALFSEMLKYFIFKHCFLESNHLLRRHTLKFNSQFKHSWHVWHQVLVSLSCWCICVSNIAKHMASLHTLWKIRAKNISKQNNAPKKQITFSKLRYWALTLRSVFPIHFLHI